MAIVDFSRSASEIEALHRAVGHQVRPPLYLALLYIEMVFVLTFRLHVLYSSPCALQSPSTPHWIFSSTPSPSHLSPSPNLQDHAPTTQPPNPSKSPAEGPREGTSSLRTFRSKAENELMRGRVGLG